MMELGGLWRKTLTKGSVFYIWLGVILLSLFVVTEIILENNTRAIVTCLQFEREKSLTIFADDFVGNSTRATTVPVLVNTPTLDEAFTPENVIHWDNITKLAPKWLRTRIDISESGEARFMQYGLAPVGDVCIRPDGKLVVVGSSAGEIAHSLLVAGEAMTREWQETYNCSQGCSGVEFQDETPEGALWMPGNTTHIIPYLGNVFHNFAERVWPHITGFREPYESESVRRGVPHVQQYYVHRMHNWLTEAHEHLDRSTLMFQLGILGNLHKPGAKFLQHTEYETRPICFERLTLACVSCGRLSTKLRASNYWPALERYRKTSFGYFNIPEPKVALPPHPLRVTLYGRKDTKRRRVTNIADIANHLRSWTQPPLLVTLVDDILESGVYNQTLPQVVSLMAQTDVLITVHGGNTWATLFMPRHSAVIEIYGPCGPGTWLDKVYVPSLKLKHKTKKNPWAARIPSPLAGNTTECVSAVVTPDFTLDMAKLDEEIQSLGMPSGPRDRFPLHWMYDWHTNSY